MTTYTATIKVRLKKGVLDPEASTTKRALERLGFELEDLRSADLYEIDIESTNAEAAHDKATEMTERLLANPTIHDFDVVIEQE